MPVSANDAVAFLARRLRLLGGREDFGFLHSHTHTPMDVNDRNVCQQQAIGGVGIKLHDTACDPGCVWGPGDRQHASEAMWLVAAVFVSTERARTQWGGGGGLDKEAQGGAGLTSKLKRATTCPSLSANVTSTLSPYE